MQKKIRASQSRLTRASVTKLLGRPRLLVVGCGDVGLRLLPLLTQRYRVFALTRQALNSSTADMIRAAQAVPIQGDLDQPHSLHKLAGLARHVIHLAPPPNSGKHDPRTQHLLNCLGQGKQGKTQNAAILSCTVKARQQRLIYISTSGVYGDCSGAKIDVPRPINPQTARAVRRVAAERLIRRFGSPRKGSTQWQTAILRVPGIYAENRLPIARLQSGTPALNPDEDVYTNHIHADDLARLCRAALWHAKPQRIYHATDSSELKMGDYFDLVAAAFNLPKPPRVSRAELEKAIKPQLLSFMSESRRLDNQRLQQELRCPLRYRDVSAGISAARQSK